MSIVPENAMKKVQHIVESKFPEMKGVTPRAEKLTLEPEPQIYEKLGIALPKTRGAKDIVELQFTTKVIAGDGSEMQRIVRVLVDATGKILKITTSK
jgi:hypothetical protein